MGLLLLLLLAGILMLALWGGANWFVAKRIYQCAAFVNGKTSGKWFGIVYTLLAIPLFLGILPLPIPLGLWYALRVFGAYWMGFFVYLFMLLLLAEVVLLCVKGVRYAMPGGRGRPPLQGIRQWVTVIACGIAIATSTFGFINAAHLRVASYEITLSRPLSGEPMTIVFIADLHLSEVNSERWLPRIVRQINALEPDIVVMVGDIFNDDFYLIRRPQQAAEVLRKIDSTFGVFACLGNHDAGPTVYSMMNFLQYSNITLLNEDHAIIDERLVLIGRVDPFPSNPIYGFGEIERGELSDILARVYAELYERNLPELPIVVIDHNPINIPEYGNEIDLAIFGHTHRGQFFPGSIVTRLMYIIDHGHLPATDYTPHVLVTQGVHTWLMPMRVGTNNEVGVVVIR